MNKARLPDTPGARPQDLYRLVYVSISRIEPPGALRREIESLLNVSRQRNALAGISGALLFNRGRFAQILEGPHDALRATYVRIAGDPRHTDLSVLQFESVGARGFGHWSMAYIGNDNLTSAAFADIRRVSDFETARVTGEALYASLFEHLRIGELPSGSC